jgi:hypothetical protein
MINKLLFILAVVCFIPVCQAQPYRPYPGTSTHYDPYEYAADDSVYRERIRTQIAKERAAAIHAEEAARRDRMYSRGYGSDVDRNEDRNTLDTISQATRDIAQIAGTVKFIQGLFGN